MLKQIYKIFGSETIKLTPVRFKIMFDAGMGIYVSRTMSQQHVKKMVIKENIKLKI